MASHTRARYWAISVRPPSAPVNLEWPRNGAAKEIILAPTPEPVLEPLTDPAALAYKGIVKVFLVAYSRNTLGQILFGFTLCEFSDLLFDLRHGRGFLLFILALEMSVICQKLAFIVRIGASGIHGNRHGFCTFRFPGNHALLIHVFNRKQWKVLFKAKI